MSQDSCGRKGQASVSSVCLSLSPIDSGSLTSCISELYRLTSPTSLELPGHHGSLVTPGAGQAAVVLSYRGRPPRASLPPWGELR